MLSYPFYKISFFQKEEDMPAQVLHHILSREGGGPASPSVRPDTPAPSPNQSVHRSPGPSNGKPVTSGEEKHN